MFLFSEVKEVTTGAVLPLRRRFSAEERKENGSMLEFSQLISPSDEGRYETSVVVLIRVPFYDDRDFFGTDTHRAIEL